ncbi:unnamed protein product [Adineta ricciae]|uniref:Uncharacterized protein n=1 Tax=Adineta ricciae TaxID=249248 RepID=A0A815VZ02_ADIRI|nr:unnamed protein product [Adineta ricciae]
MPKRTLSVRNKETDDEQLSTSTHTRSSTKRASTDETVPAKKAKIEKNTIDKENVPKTQARPSNSKPKQSKPVRSPSPVQPAQVIEPVVNDDLNTSDDDDDDHDHDFNLNDSDDDDAEEVQVGSLQNQSATSSTNNDGQDHPTNKQYVVYENMGPNKEQFIVSKTARYWNKKYRKAVDNSNPDFFGMYIHNDFSAYGELEVVENCIFDLIKSIFLTQQRGLGRLKYTEKPASRVNYVLGFRRLEVLTLLLVYTDGISGIDDGDRFYAIMRVIGACYVTILRGLLPQAMFEKIQNIDRNVVKRLATISKQIPNFKQVLEQALTTGHMLVTIGDLCSTYTKVLQTVYCNWLYIMENLTIDFNTKPTNMQNNLWTSLRHANSIDQSQLVDGEPETFELFKELNVYQSEYSFGGDGHDISKWPRSERAIYSLTNIRPSIDLWF